MTMVKSYVMFVLPNVISTPFNMTKKKENVKYDKSMVKKDVGTARCDNETVK